MLAVDKIYWEAFGPINHDEFKVVFCNTDDGRPDTLYPEGNSCSITTIRLTANEVKGENRHYPLQLAYQYGHELFHVYQRLAWCLMSNCPRNSFGASLKNAREVALV